MLVRIALSSESPEGTTGVRPRVQTRAPAVASRLFESIFTRSLGLASQANTCHRFAAKDAPNTKEEQSQLFVFFVVNIKALSIVLTR